MKRLLTALLLLASTAAHAQTSSWAFTYTGFYDREAARFLPDARLSGSFGGGDANGDGVLERDELTVLVVDGKDYVACAAGSNADYHCGIDRFTFSPADDLSFVVGEYGQDPEGWVGAGHIVITGDTIFDYRFTPLASTEHHLDWTKATMLSVVPVPEPASWTMLAAGLAGGGWLRGRRALSARRAAG